MLESYFRNLVAAKHLPDPLVAQLRRFTTSLVERGYADCTVRQKLQLLTNFGQWLGRNNFAVTRLDEQLVEAFLKRKRRVHRGDLKTLQQFLDHLRMHNVVPTRSVACDRPPWAGILPLFFNLSSPIACFANDKRARIRSRDTAIASACFCSLPKNDSAKCPPRSGSKTSMLPLLASSSITWKALAKIAHAPGMPGWVPSTLSSDTWL